MSGISMNSKRISIIVPAYNVDEWIDQCLESITNQSFSDFEILVIDDGSTDNTGMRCQEWVKQDNRINYYRIIHGGLSSARNYGISIANGEYLIFIDSDDWIDKHYVEKLYTTAVNSDVDIAECDFWRYDNNTGQCTYRPCYGRMGVAYTKEERLLYGESVVWKCIFKKDVWDRFQVLFPDCLGASHVVYVLLILLGAKFENIREPLYYYRRMRKGSILDNNGVGTLEQGNMGVKELESLLHELEKRELLDDNIQIIERAIKYRMSDLLASQYSRNNYIEYMKQRDSFYSYIRKIFPNSKNYKYLVVGGYNLNRTLSYLNCIQDPYCRFNFSSIVSIANPISMYKEINHKNSYRRNMIEKDIYSLFWNVIDEIKPEIVFINLIDDRFDVLKVDDGYITLSDAYAEVKTFFSNQQIISVNTNEYKKLWKDSADFFFSKLRKSIGKGHIVVVEDYMSIMHGDTTEQSFYDNVIEIECANEELNKKYKYIKEKNPDITWISAYKQPMYFTDDEYEYGVVPQHLNEVVNKKIARNIEEELKKVFY